MKKGLFFGNIYWYICIYKYRNLKKEVILEKESCNVKCEKIEGGYRVEVTGMDLKDKSAGCCIPVVLNCCDTKSECCPPEKKE
jgi:hypothetical protein